MSRRRDYQPTIDRARSQAEIAQRREAKLREKKDDCHREMLRAQAAARIAGEEAEALRDRIVGLEQSARDLRSENTSLKKRVGSLSVELGAIHEARLTAERRSIWWHLQAWAGERWRAMLVIGAEA